MFWSAGHLPPSGCPDIHKVIEEQGKKDGRIGAQNAWPVDMLQPEDVCVCDNFGLKQHGPSIGDNVGKGILAKIRNGIAYDGAVRDIAGLKELSGFTSFVRSYDPSHHFSSIGERPNSTMIDINTPIRIGRALAMPGDVVLGGDGGVIFVPPQLAEGVVKTSEAVRLCDMVGHQRLREKKYTAGQFSRPRIEKNLHLPVYDRLHFAFLYTDDLERATGTP